MKTWPQLETLAASDRLRLFRTTSGATIYTTDMMPAPLVAARPRRRR
jgi:hypothetical protein